jgi:hypothetical protein
MLRIAIMVLCMLAAAPAYAELTVEGTTAGQPVALDIGALPPICRSAAVLPAVNFEFWLNLNKPVQQRFNVKNLVRTAWYGVEIAADLCSYEIRRQIRNIIGGP